MSKVVLDVSMSLDGFIAGPNGREAEPRRIPPRKSGPPRRSRGTPIRIQRRASRSRNCPRRLRTRTSRAASSLDTSDLTRVRQERSGSGDRCTSHRQALKPLVRYWRISSASVVENNGNFVAGSLRFEPLGEPNAVSSPLHNLCHRRVADIVQCGQRVRKVLQINSLDNYLQVEPASY